METPEIFMQLLKLANILKKDPLVGYSKAQRLYKTIENLEMNYFATLNDKESCENNKEE